MMQFAKMVCLLLVGVILGWLLRDADFQHSRRQYSTALPQTNSLSQHARPNAVTEFNEIAEQNIPQREQGEVQSSADRFRQLLVSEQFDAAIDYYGQVQHLHNDDEPLLRLTLERHLALCATQCKAGAFVELVNTWLTSYYRDIPVLLLLADYQRVQGQPEEAANTLQLAAAYADRSAHIEDVSAAVQQLVLATDDKLSQQENWIELLGFYEYLETIDLGTPEHRLREAVLYRVVGETQRARELLLDLQRNDSMTNTAWTATIERELSHVAIRPGPSDSAGRTTGVIKHGDHFIVPVNFNDATTANLLIDTGASLTTLSQAAFLDLTQTRFSYVGSRMFNTANGLARGEVYRASFIELAGIRLDDIDVAVLDYPAAPNIDGLLGMNVLRNFRFEIDQDKALLRLYRR